MRSKTLLPVLAAAALGSSLLAGCGGASDDPAAAAAGGGDARTTLSLVAYSTPEVVYDEIIPGFQKTPAGEGVGFKTSFGASGDQSRAVEGGLHADVVAFSLAPDVDRLVGDGLVAGDWADTPTKGLVSTSVVALVVRKGNPKGIHGWDDLLKPGVEVVTPNPFTSGSAKWNLLGAYQHGGLPYVRTLLTDHVKVQPKSGREALQTFTSGEGDVLISYENEALTAQKKGEDVDYVIPSDTFKIDNPIAVTKDASPAAKAFVDYALSTPAQERFAAWGYRPVDASVLKANASRFPDPKKLVTIDDVGGWDVVDPQLFDADTGAIAKIEEDAGVSTAS
ncbi:MAG TPA: extracellular solute-binding protein [Baekduia sp.]|nr:extracellular solute-binding protein [Baekduia sp.]